MINLAGIKEADVSIQEELRLAGIEMVKGEPIKGEVPYSITGKVSDWTLSRAWSYWIASAPNGKGLLLDVATELHERKYPISGERQPENYGGVIRVAGNCGCPHPSGWATHYDAQGLRLVVDPEGRQEADLRSSFQQNPAMKKAFEVLRFVPNLDGVVAKSIVDSYHIDSQVGLNEFARAVRES